MGNLADNKALCRYVRNILLSQKRFIEASAPVTEGMILEFIAECNEKWMKTMYVSGAIDIDTFETMLDYKYGLPQQTPKSI